MEQVLRRGIRGQLVKEAQGLINGYFGIIKVEQDTHFGPATEQAVKEFQAAARIKVDGVIGPTTWAALRSRGNPSGKSVTGFDPFDLRTLENFFGGLRQLLGGSGGFSDTVGSATAIRRSPAATHSNSPPATKSAAANAPTALPKVVSVQDFKSFSRMSFEGYAGKGYVIKNFRKFERHAIQLTKDGPEIRKNDASGMKNECAHFVQYFGIPNTRTWRRGPRVCDFKPGELAVGTVIATLRDGKYHSDYSGRSHVAIYLSHSDYQNGANPDGVVEVMDQFNGRVIGVSRFKYCVVADKKGNKAKKPWTDSSGVVQTHRVSWGRDGEEYYVLLTNE